MKIPAVLERNGHCGEHLENHLASEKGTQRVDFFALNRQTVIQHHSTNAASAAYLSCCIRKSSVSCTENAHGAVFPSNLSNQPRPCPPVCCPALHAEGNILLSSGLSCCCLSDQRATGVWTSIKVWKEPLWSGFVLTSYNIIQLTYLSEVISSCAICTVIIRWKRFPAWQSNAIHIPYRRKTFTVLDAPRELPRAELRVCASIGTHRLPVSTSTQKQKILASV